ncbi:hypothetical protein PV350_42670 [Streptomyces sp. PA03-6a]|nr:hypothetical protein [Streptomyces sp. PA03-6a]
MAILLAVAAVFASVLLAQPASANDTLHYKGAVAETDDNPGNGAASWIWISAGSLNWDFRAANLEYQLINGTSDVLYANRGEAVARSLNSELKAIRLCVYTNYGDGYYCSDWRYYA